MTSDINTTGLPATKSTEAGYTFTTDQDDVRLSEMGYSSELYRKFSLLSILSVGFSISNSWWAVTGALVTGIMNGGAAIYIYGTILVALVHVAIGASLGELASAYPNAGGQYYWVIMLAPESYKRFLSYFTGVVSWAGAMITGASVSLVVGQGVVGIIILCRPEITYHPWMAVIGYQMINMLVFFLNCYSRILPNLSKASFYISLFSFLVITLSILIASPQKASIDSVFRGFSNFSGWDSNAICFFTGLLGVNWGFSCLDACTHMAEELPKPDRNVPKAILGTVAIGFVTSWVYSIAILFSIQDLDAIIETPTFVPNLELFKQALRGSIAGTIALEILVLLTGIGCLMSIHTWQCRLMWSFSRDNGFPFSSHLSRVAPAPYNVPLWAHIFSTFWIAVLGFLYLISTSAFGSLVTGCILMQYVSYTIPVVLLMLQNRKLSNPGPFRLGRWGWLANGILVGWALFTLVFYSFPFVIPVTGGNMNYVSVVMAIIFAELRTILLLREVNSMRINPRQVE
ncbi:uncharacterized protein H6S33_006903 [Morchella sextelata]|uniref:uncharacterized protein n=1 Tax=Morchella sextelata TaxID=1174677 RepID=UPI001D04635D|nr:uncharacterized protein H6S33_006903 [Morchella sextelata]KAH0604526.1 hypothetical protein H6S33_006903 [Morchella sextelata]